MGKKNTEDWRNNPGLETWQRGIANYNPEPTPTEPEGIDKWLVQEVINRMTDLSVDTEEYKRRLRELNEEFPTKVKVFGGEKIQKFDEFH